MNALELDLDDDPGPRYCRSGEHEMAGGNIMRGKAGTQCRACHTNARRRARYASEQGEAERAADAGLIHGRHPAMGHKFGAGNDRGRLVCPCGRTFKQHQRKPVACERKHPGEEDE